MTPAEIRECIAALDTSWSPPIVTVTGLKYRGGGGSGAFDAETGDDDVRYVIKAMNNNHEPQALPLKVVATELICARLGGLMVIESPTDADGRGRRRRVTQWAELAGIEVVDSDKIRREADRLAALIKALEVSSVPPQVFSLPGSEKEMGPAAVAGPIR